MFKLNQEQLAEKFPYIFKKIKHLECNEGWDHLLFNLFSIIEAHILRLPEELRDGIYATQIKEKFGSARIYFNQTTPFIKGAIAMAEGMSAHICEVCGMPGERRFGGWILALCDQHHQEREDKKK